MSSLSIDLLPGLETRPIIRWRWAVGTLLALAALAPRAGFMARPFESDAGLYIYMGKVVAEGGTIYRDFYETKPPGVPLMTAGLYELFGHQWAPYVVLQTLLAMLAAFLLAKTASDFGLAVSGRGVRANWIRETGRGQAALGAFFFALVFLNFSPLAYRGFQLETITTSLACIGAFFGVRAIRESSDETDRWTGTLLCGLFAGSAAMIKPTAGAVFGALMVAILLPSRPKAREGPSARRGSAAPIAFGVLGLLLVPGLALAWTSRHGVLDEMAPLLREISLYGAQTPLVWLDLVKPAMVLVFVGFPFVIVWRVFRGRRDEAPSMSGRVFWFAVAWLILEVIGVYVQKRMYTYHFLPLAAPLAILFGLLCAKSSRIGPTRLAAALGPILVISLAQSTGDFRKLVRGEELTLPESRWLLAHASPGDRVVGDPIERLLMETGLRCGSRYAHLFYFANHDRAPSDYTRQFLYDLDCNRPRWAVFAVDRAEHRQWQINDLAMFNTRPLRAQRLLEAWKEIDGYLERHYRLVVTVGGKAIYRRVDSKQGAQ